MASAAPDLTVTAVSATPSTVPTGGTLSVASTVRSSGGATGAFTVAFYLSTDTAITAADVYLGSRQVTSLASGASSTATTSVSVPPGLKGTYYVGAIVDFGNAVSESNESNNARAAAAATTVNAPDLQVTALTRSPATLPVGGTVSVTDTVTSTGAASAASTVTYFLASDAALTQGRVQLGTRAVPALGAGATSTATNGLALPAGLEGTFFLGAVVDVAGVVPESNEANNTRSAGTITISNLPDLQVSAHSVTPTTVPAGGWINIDTVVSNAGAWTSGAWLYYVLSTDAAATQGRIEMGWRAVGGLPFNGSAVVSDTWAIPVGISGAYYVTAIADPLGEVAETDEGNNARVAGPITITRPDLRVSALSASPTTVPAGGPLTFTDTVVSADAGCRSVWVRYVLSTDAAATQGRIEWGNRFYGSLPPDGTSTATNTWPVPVGISGAYYLTAIVNPDGEVAETNGSNNTRVVGPITITQPDLRVSALSATPASVPAGGLLTVTDTVVSAGAASKTVSVRYVLSTDAAATQGRVVWGNRFYGGLPPDGTSTATNTWPVPVGISGTYYFTATVDPDGEVAETDEGNNTRVVGPITITAPDLRITALAVTPSRAAAGDLVDVTDTITSVAAASPRLPVRYVLAADAALTQIVIDLGGGRDLPPLAADQSSTVKTTLWIPFVTPATYYLGAIVDPQNALAETDESNNARAVKFVLAPPPPDLVVTALSAPSSTAAGTALAVSDTVANASASNAAGATMTAYFLSTDTEASGDDWLLGTSPTPALAPGARSSAQTDLVIPAVPAGTYYLVSVADGLDDVYETNEGNNGRAVALAVTATSAGPMVTHNCYDDAGNLRSTQSCRQGTPGCPAACP